MIPKLECTLASAENKAEVNFLGFAPDGSGIYFQEDLFFADGPKPSSTSTVYFRKIGRKGSHHKAKDVTREFKNNKVTRIDGVLLPNKDGKPTEDKLGIQFILEDQHLLGKKDGPRYKLTMMEMTTKKIRRVYKGRLNLVHDVHGLARVYRYNDSALYGIGMKYMDNNILEAESVHYIMLDLKSPMAILLRQAGLELRKQKKWKEAGEKYEKSLELQPENAISLFALAKIAALSGNDGEAFSKTAHAVAVNPKLKKRFWKDRAFKKLRKDKNFKGLIR